MKIIRTIILSITLILTMMLPSFVCLAEEAGNIEIHLQNMDGDELDSGDLKLTGEADWNTVYNNFTDEDFENYEVENNKVFCGKL